MANGNFNDLNFVDHQESKDAKSTVRGLRSPDVGGYLNTDPTVSYSALDFATLNLIVEAKINPDDDPFLDKAAIDNYKHFLGTKPGQKDASQRRVAAQGQLVAYATEVFNQQHRTHLFLVLLHKSHARIFRFERSGAVVTEMIPYKEQGHVLVEFLWKYSQMTRAEQGFDPTVTLATETESLRAKEALIAFYPDNQLERPVYKVQLFETHKIKVENESDGGEVKHEVLIWIPLADSSVVGRGTRGWPALDVKSGDVGFLKDSWRDEALFPEFETLRELNAANIPNVPTLVCGGRVLDQVTTMDLYVNRAWRVKHVSQGVVYHEPIVRRLHQRQFTEEVLSP